MTNKKTPPAFPAEAPTRPARAMLMPKKYRVTRMLDGSEPSWPLFVLGAGDRAAVEALGAYARAAREMQYDSQYVAMIESKLAEFNRWRKEFGISDVGTTKDYVRPR